MRGKKPENTERASPCCSLPHQPSPADRPLRTKIFVLYRFRPSVLAPKSQSLIGWASLLDELLFDVISKKKNSLVGLSGVSYWSKKVLHTEGKEVTMRFPESVLTSVILDDTGA